MLCVLQSVCCFRNALFNSTFKLFGPNFVLFDFLREVKLLEKFEHTVENIMFGGILIVGSKI